MRLILMMKMMIIGMNCFCGMVDRRKAFELIFSRDHCERSSPSRISDTPRARFEHAQNLSLGFVEWSYAVGITTTARRHLIELFNRKLVILPTSNHKVNWSTWCKIKTTMKLILIVKLNVVELFHQKLTTKSRESSYTIEKNTMTLIWNVRWKVLNFTIKNLPRITSSNSTEVLLAWHKYFY